MSNKSVDLYAHPFMHGFSFGLFTFWMAHGAAFCLFAIKVPGERNECTLG